ncbi:MAG: M24 family metallopeptidase, partial [Actinobacteria bacterium]|nr:M24 family metallopeptidase [Actinomycetota bacterium]
FGCRFKNYCTDMTRTIFLNKIKNHDKLTRIYDIVLRAQTAALNACRDGVSCGYVDSIARNIIEEEGFGKYFGHGTGHGVGLEVHEKPYVAPGNKEILKENMIITIEPGIYIEGLGGVRIEDMVLVEKRSCRTLYKSPKNLIILN